MIKYIRLKQQFDAERMQQEIAQLETALWKGHYNRDNYEGSWSTLQLRSMNGQLDNNFVNHAGGLQNANLFQDTSLLAQCPYIRKVLDFFEIEKTAVRLMKLDAHAVIKPHRDHDLNFEEGEVRIHIPVRTNPQLKFYLEEERLVMEEGSCWYLNLSLPHSVRNEGDTSRVHLVLDGLVNDWLRTYFQAAQHAVVVMADPQPANQHSRQEKLQIIAQLRLMQTPVADSLADEMQASL